MYIKIKSLSPNYAVYRPRRRHIYADLIIRTRVYGGRASESDILFRVPRKTYGERNPPTTINGHLLNEGALRRKIG